MSREGKAEVPGLMLLQVSAATLEAHSKRASACHPCRMPGAPLPLVPLTAPQSFAGARDPHHGRSFLAKEPAREQEQPFSAPQGQGSVLVLPCTHRAGQHQGHARQRAVAGAQHLVLESHLATVLQGELCFSNFIKQLWRDRRRALSLLRWDNANVGNPQLQGIGTGIRAGL